MERTLLYTWTTVPTAVLFGFIGIIIHRKGSFLLMLLSGFWLLGRALSQMSIFGLITGWKSVLSSAFPGYLLSDHSEHCSIHPSLLRATNFPATRLNYLLQCCSQQFERSGYAWPDGWRRDQSDRATWGKPASSQMGRAQGSLTSCPHLLGCSYRHTVGRFTSLHCL